MSDTIQFPGRYNLRQLGEAVFKAFDLVATQLRNQDGEIEALEAQNRDLLRRVERLERERLRPNRQR